MLLTCFSTCHKRDGADSDRMLHTGPDTKAQKAWGNSKPISSHETNLVQFGGSSNTACIGAVFGVSGMHLSPRHATMCVCERAALHMTIILASICGSCAECGAVFFNTAVPGSSCWEALERDKIQYGDILFSVNGLTLYRAPLKLVAAKLLGPVGSTVKVILRRGKSAILLDCKRRVTNIKATQMVGFSWRLRYLRCKPAMQAHARCQIFSSLPRFLTNNLVFGRRFRLQIARSVLL